MARAKSSEQKDNKELKEELVEYIDSKIDEKIDLSKINKDVKEYVDLLVKKDLTNEVEKANKRLLREKNRKIFFKNLIIIILIVVIGFLVYLLYKAHYFDKYFVNEDTPQVIVDKKEEEVEKDTQTNHVPTFEELESEYGDLIKDIYINENSKYIKDYYSGVLSNEIKTYIALNKLSFDKLSVEEDYNVIDSSDIEIEYKKLFNDKFNKATFDYNGNKLRYVTKLDSYMTDSILTKTKSNIKREIIDIEVDDDIVTITTVEGLVKDGKLYNILTNEVVKNYKKDSLSKYEDELNKISYVFDNKKLDRLEE